MENNLGFECLCGHDNYKKTLSGTYPSTLGERAFSIIQCKNCGLSRTYPPPYEDELGAEIYQDFSFQEQFENQVLWRSFFKNIISTAKKYKNHGRFLDVGCGSGLLVLMAQESGYDACGVEINKAAAQYARDVHGLNVISGDLKSAGFPSQYFDVITLSQVLEHITQPEFLLSEIHRILKPTGVLLIEVPNISGLVTFFWGTRWSGLQPQWHVWQFNNKTVSAVLARYGFEVLDVQCKENIHVGNPILTFKKIIRITIYQLLELVSQVIGRADKALVTARIR